MHPILALALAGTALAAPPRLSTRDSGKGQTALYWGQNSMKVFEKSDLTEYCKKDSGVDILILGFLHQYGGGTVIPGGSFDRSCGVEKGTGKPKGCEYLAKQIATCQSAGVKVLMSLGGASNQNSLASKDEAEKIAQNLWDAYGPPGKSKIPRPFGDVALDGFDFDIETDKGADYYADLITKLRSNFPKDGKHLITGAPQCPVPEHNIQYAIQKSQFDYLFVQFYNNGRGCTAGNRPSWDKWKKNIAGTSSKDAKIFIGVPASTDAANDNADSKTYYVKPADLLNQVNMYKDDPAFGGVMAWSAGFSDKNVENNCNYIQQAKSILTKGKTC